MTQSSTGFTMEEAQALLDYFDPKELAQLLARQHATHHGGPDTRAKFRRTPDGIYVPEGDGPVHIPGTDPSSPLDIGRGHEFHALPFWFDEWAESDFYVPDRIDPQTFRPTPEVGPVVLMHWQKVILRYMLDRHRPLEEWYSNLIISTLKKTGKALSLDTPLPTPSGWTTMQDVAAGDYLFDERGFPTQVVRATEVMEGHDCFAVHFSDGETIIADADHQWEVEHLHNTDYVKRIYTTRELSDPDVLYRKGDHAHLNRIPVAHPLDTEEAELPISPYVLGAWLGDGSSGTGEITSVDPEILDNIALYETVAKRATKDSLYLIGSGGRTQAARNVSFQARLRSLGVLHCKHIPAVYLRASYEQRLALLQGLMDTDGYIDKARGTSGATCEFSVTSEALALGARELITTLGFKTTLHINSAKLYGKDCGLRWRIAFQAPAELPVFRLKRKLERQRSAAAGTFSRKRSTSRHIIAVDPVPSVPVRCVEVDSPSHLYLAGKSMIPTHNSLLAAAIGRFVAETFGNYSEVICLGADKEQAEDKLYAAITKSIELSPAYDADLQVLFGLMPHPEDPDPQNPTIFAPNYADPRWRLRSHGAQHIPNHGTIKAVPRVYQKLAGGNQTAALFTEMWTWTDQTARRLFDEMTPPPTRPRSIRLMEGYAGFEGESGLWEELWDQAMNPKLGARMVTREELEPYGGWPFPPAPHSFVESDYPEHRNHPDPIPLYVNPGFSTCAFIDQGEVARRMPWQTQAYYDSQRGDESYDRHHRNVKSAHKEEFVPKHWWDSCNIINHPGYTRRSAPSGSPFPGKKFPPVALALRTVPPLLPSEPLVLSADASVNNDCTVLMAITYATWWEYLEPEPDPAHFTDAYLRQHPEQEKKRRRRTDESQTMIRKFHIWEPSKKRPMNYTTQFKPVILSYHGYAPLAADTEDSSDPNFDNYSPDPTYPEHNVLEVCYDRYMIHDLMINMRNEYGIWIKEFSQQTGRDIADNDLYVAIRDHTLWHGGYDDPEDEAKLDSHRAAAARRVPKVANSNTAERRHLDKKTVSGHIDLFVTASMGNYELRRMEG